MFANSFFVVFLFVLCKKVNNKFGTDLQNSYICNRKRKDDYISE